MSTQLIAKVKSEYKNILNQDENILNDFDISVIEEITFATGYTNLNIKCRINKLNYFLSGLGKKYQHSRGYGFIF